MHVMSVVNRTSLLNRHANPSVPRMSQSTLSLSPAARTDEPPLPFAIRILRRLNPVIAATLRSPVHGLVSKNLLLLTYVGAKSGVAWTLPLSYVEVGGRLYLCTRSSRWWRDRKSVV